MLKKVKQLKKGSKIAIVSPSWGGPHVYLEAYLIGLDYLKNELGFEIIEYNTTRANPEKNYLSPKDRAMDLIAAFQDDTIDGIICSIGGDDSIRLLEHLNGVELPQKFFMGYSDSTVLLNYLSLRGFITFHGPSVMAGFYEPGGLKKEFRDHLNSFLFQDNGLFEYKSYGEWTQYPFDLENTQISRPYVKNGGWELISPNKKEVSRVISGELIGGSMEAFDFFKGTKYWNQFDWENKILLLELSEDRPHIDGIKWIIRNYGVQGVFKKLNGIVLGRIIHKDEEELLTIYEAILKVIHQEFKEVDLPIIANVDFGHTYPQQIFPIGGDLSITINNDKITSINSKNPFK
jgi:muramoyltetrapeptide carboxypeptidase LdcA involved in peptidoglycan recycling